MRGVSGKAGFSQRPSKGSHIVWEHPDLPDELSLSGGDGDDAKPYQAKDVRDVLEKLKEVQK